MKHCCAFLVSPLAMHANSKNLAPSMVMATIFTYHFYCILYRVGVEDEDIVQPGLQVPGVVSICYMYKYK